MFGSVYLPKSEFVVITIIENVHKVGIEGVYFLEMSFFKCLEWETKMRVLTYIKFWKVFENLAQLLVKSILFHRQSC
jgi:hypothetical protein